MSNPKYRTFHLGELTSRSIAPLHRYLVTDESTLIKSDDPTSCLFSEVKACAGYAELSTEPTPEANLANTANVIDESFIDYTNFINLIDKKRPQRPEIKKVSWIFTAFV